MVSKGACSFSCLVIRIDYVLDLGNIEHELENLDELCSYEKGRKENLQTISQSVQIVFIIRQHLVQT